MKLEVTGSISGLGRYLYEKWVFSVDFWSDILYLNIVYLVKCTRFWYYKIILHKKHSSCVSERFYSHTKNDNKCI